MDDHDLCLTFEKVRAPRVLVQDLGEDPEHDRDESQNDMTHLKFVSDLTPKKNKEQRNTIESDDYKDSGEWLLDQLDLTSLDGRPKDLQEKAKEILRRNASIYSKHDLDMGKTIDRSHSIQRKV